MIWAAEEVAVKGNGLLKNREEWIKVGGCQKSVLQGGDVWIQSVQFNFFQGPQGESRGVGRVAENNTGKDRHKPQCRESQCRETR